MISPADINRKQFATTRIREGYDQNEVDDFLDRVEVDYANALKENDALRRRPTNPPEAVTQVVPVTPSASAERLLEAAQKIADEVVAEANVEAGKIRDAADAVARNITLAAEADRQQILTRLAGEQAELEDNVHTLRAKRTTYKSWLKAALTKLEEEEASDG